MKAIGNENKKNYFMKNLTVTLINKYSKYLLITRNSNRKVSKFA